MRIPERLQWWIIAIFVGWAFVICAGEADGQVPHDAGTVAAPENTRKESPKKTGAAALNLARICKLEAEAKLADCTAIYHIGIKRYGEERWLTGLLDYSRLMKRSNPRARRIATLPWGSIRARGREARDWILIQQHALALLHGLWPDNCPEAMDWNCPGCGTQGPRQVPATCAAQEQTANTLYRLR